MERVKTSLYVWSGNTFWPECTEERNCSPITYKVLEATGIIWRIIDSSMCGNLARIIPLAE